MNIAKLLAGAVVLASPASILAAQSAVHADSSRGPSHGEWIAGAGAAAAAGLFLAFTHTGHAADASVGSYGFHGTNTNPGTPANPPGGLAPSPAGGSSPSSPNPVPADTTTSPDTSSFTPDAPKGSNPPTVGTDSNTYQNGPPAPPGPVGDPPPPPPRKFFAVVAPTSTVPEPGSLALTVTGLVGLLPLIRRRK